MLKNIELKAITENYKQLYEWWQNIVADCGFCETITNKVNICIEEIFVNIASYAYRNESGSVKVSFDKNNDEIMLKFEDYGIEYDPLKNKTPDIAATIEERPIGGLGIFMVREFTKEMHYKRENNKNILILKFDTK